MTLLEHKVLYWLVARVVEQKSDGDSFLDGHSHDKQGSFYSDAESARLQAGFGGRLDETVR